MVGGVLAGSPRMQEIDPDEIASVGCIRGPCLIVTGKELLAGRAPQRPENVIAYYDGISPQTWKFTGVYKNVILGVPFSPYACPLSGNVILYFLRR